MAGQYERAFYGSQYAPMAPLFEDYGVQLWMPETGGPGRLRLGARREDDGHAGFVVQAGDPRTSIRVRTAIAVQTRKQGRYLGPVPLPGHDRPAVIARCWPGGRFRDSQCERLGASVFTSFSPACLAMRADAGRARTARRDQLPGRKAQIQPVEGAARLLEARTGGQVSEVDDGEVVRFEC